MYPYHDHLSLQEIDAACERDLNSFKERSKYLFYSDEKLLSIGFRTLGRDDHTDQADMENAISIVFPFMPDSIVARIVYLYNYYVGNGYMPSTTWSGPRWIGFLS